jgi:hypothetical protein
MVLKKAARGVQMDREAILQEGLDPEPTSAPPAAPKPVLARTQPVVDLRQAAAEESAPAAVAVPAAATHAPSAAKSAAKREQKPKPAPAPAAPVGNGWSYTVLLTAEQWAWVESEASRRGIAKRYVLLSAVDKHRKAIADHFRTTVQESANLFHWTGEPKDIEGHKVGKSLRFPPAEREILQGLIEEANAPSMAMYLRIAADIEMRAQGVA